jgi:hypothetical protein
MTALKPLFYELANPAALIAATRTWYANRLSHFRRLEI